MVIKKHYRQYIKEMHQTFSIDTILAGQNLIGGQPDAGSY